MLARFGDSAGLLTTTKIQVERPARSSTAHAADAAVHAMVFLIFQLRNSRRPTTFSIENPRGSSLFEIPAVRRLYAYPGSPLRLVSVSYCAYGGGSPKPSIFLLSRELDYDYHPLMCIF